MADASGTLLFDVANRRWSAEVCDALEIPLEWLPPVHESTAIAGAGDQAAAALGVGIAAPGPGIGRPRHLGRRLLGAAVLRAGRAGARARLLPRGAGHVARDGGHAERRGVGGVAPPRAGERRTRSSTPRRIAGNPAPEGLLFAPYLAGERTPYPDPDARGAFTGLSLRHDRGALWRAMLEGVAFGLRDSLELLRGLGAQPEVGRVSGGGARSELWLRIVSSVLGLPLDRMETEEGSAFGAALLAGVRAGTFADADEAVGRCVRVRSRVEPAWDYEEQYRRFRSLYPALKAIDD